MVNCEKKLLQTFDMILNKKKRIVLIKQKSLRNDSSAGNSKTFWQKITSFTNIRNEKESMLQFKLETMNLKGWAKGYHRLQVLSGPLTPIYTKFGVVVI